MDRGPFRPQRPVQRAANTPANAPYRPPEVVQPAKETPKTVHHSATSHRMAIEEKSFRRFVKPVLIAAAILIIGLAGWFAWSGFAKSPGLAIDGSKYQAVFFTNGQVYFGKLKPLNHEYMKLTDIYYLQTKTDEKTDSKNPQETSADQGVPELIKLGGEIHGPEDEMIISKDQLLFYENLKTDGQVAKSIKKHKGQN